MYFFQFQQTALHLASEEGYCDIVQLLLKSNADPNICDEVSAYFCRDYYMLLDLNQYLIVIECYGCGY